MLEYCYNIMYVCTYCMYVNFAIKVIKRTKRSHSKKLKEKGNLFTNVYYDRNLKDKK